jgi:polynucleotide 5'-hydroxyl-kinase GRC3/NOL9
MPGEADETDLPTDWSEALARAAPFRRILVLGATDMGKTRFIRQLMEVRAELRLIDLDPGQKMIGPPGTASLGGVDTLERFIFLGSTSASNLGGIGRAAAALSTGAGAPFAVNTAGFVAGLGARLQAITAKAIAPDLVIEIGPDPASDPILAPVDGVPLIRLQRSPAARRKSPSVRAGIRQRAFEEALAGAEPLSIAASFHPGAPVLSPGAERPVCALTDDAGADMCLALLQGVSEDAVHLEAPPPPRPVRLVRLGKMWAEPRPGGWKLLDKLSPSWSA